MSHADTIAVRVVAVEQVTPQIKHFKLAAVDGSRLPAFSGAAVRLTAFPVVAISRCKHNYLRERNNDYAEMGGDSGGTATLKCAGAHCFEFQLRRSATGKWDR